MAVFLEIVALWKAQESELLLSALSKTKMPLSLLTHLLINMLLIRFELSKLIRS